MLVQDLSVIAPEIVLSLFAMAALLGAVYSGKDALAVPLIWLSAGLFALTAFWIGATGDGTQTHQRLFR